MPAQHWSKDMYILAWNDTKSGGRMRLSWHKDKAKLQKMAQEMPDGSDPVLYAGLDKRVPMVGVGATVKPKAKKRKPKAKPADAPAEPVAA